MFVLRNLTKKELDLYQRMSIMAKNDAFRTQEDGYIYYIKSPEGGIFIPTEFEKMENLLPTCYWWSSDNEVVFKDIIPQENVLCWIQHDWDEDDIPDEPPIKSKSPEIKSKKLSTSNIRFQSDDKIENIREFIKDDYSDEIEEPEKVSVLPGSKVNLVTDDEEKRPKILDVPSITNDPGKSRRRFISKYPANENDISVKFPSINNDPGKSRKRFTSNYPSSDEEKVIPDVPVIQPELKKPARRRFTAKYPTDYQINYIHSIFL